MTEVRRLPQSLAVGREETLPGYLDRLAYHLELPLGVLYRSVGLAPEGAVVRRVSGVSLAEQVKARLSFGTGLPVEAVNGTLLDQFEGCVYPARPEDKHFGPVTWAYSSGSLCCCSCLAGTDDVTTRGIWQLRWRFVWSFACLRHARLLIARCPTCGNLLGGARKDRSRDYASSAFVADPLRCTHVVRGIGWTSERCDQCLTTVQTPSLARNTRLLRAQETIDAALGGVAIPSSNGLLPSLVLFSELRSVAALVFRSGTLEHLGSLPCVAIGAFERFAARRAAVHADKEASTGEGGSRTPRFKAYGWLPHDPALIAAILPLCVEIVSAPTAAEMTKRLAPLVESACAGQRRVPRDLMTNYAFDDRLRDAFEESALPRTRLNYVLRNQRAISELPLPLSHVPQLFWEDLYETHLAVFLPGVRKATGRQFASASLCQSLGASSWEGACAVLDLLPQPAGLMHCAEIINQAGNRRAYAGALEAAVAALEERHRRDYAALRRALTDVVEVPIDTWLSVLPEKPRRKVPPTTCRYAAAWLWADLASGDYRLSPAMRLIVAQPSRAEYPAARAYGAYRTWVRTRLSDQIAAGLRAYGEDLISALPLGAPRFGGSRPQAARVRPS